MNDAAQTIKYGVISMGDLLRDLWTWDSLVVAGRLHKPVCHIIKDPAVMKAVAVNLHASVATSLLLLPRDFSTQVVRDSANKFGAIVSCQSATPHMKFLFI